MNRFAAIAAFSWIWLIAGCAEVLVPGTLAGGGEAYRYSTANVAKRTFMGDTNRITAATRRALEKMGIDWQFIGTEDHKTEISAATDELDITIELKPITAHTTKVSVNAVEDRIFKDKATADEILDQIQLALDRKPPPAASFPRVFVKNYCRHPIEVIVYYLVGQTGPKSWQTRGWFHLDPGQTKYVADTHNRYIYFYGETTPDDKMTWTGDMLQWFEGNRYPFFKVDMGTALKDYTYAFTCE